MDDNKILILDAEFPNTLTFLSYFHSLGWKTFAGSSQRFAISFFSRFSTYKYHHPPTGYLCEYGKGKLFYKINIKLFLSSFKKFLERSGIRKVICLSEASLIPTSMNVEELKIERFYPSYPIINFLHDKFLMFEKLNGIDIKSFSFPVCYSLDKLEFPCVIRPTKGAGSSHVYACKNLKETRKALNILKIFRREPLIQEFLPNKEGFSLNLLVDKDGKIVRSLSSMKVPKKEIIKIIKDLEKFFKSIGYFGLASPQFLLVDDKPYLTEINPRLSVYYYGLDFGVNFSKAFHELFIEGKKIKKIFKFMPSFPRFLYSSKIYLEDTGDVFPVIKAIEEHTKAFIIKPFLTLRTIK